MVRLMAAEISLTEKTGRLAKAAVSAGAKGSVINTS